MNQEPQLPVEAFIILAHNELEAVFRYHLARSGDWQAAQAFSAFTLDRALEEYDPVQAGRDPCGWLFRRAVIAQARRRRGEVYASPDGSTLSPTQDQLAGFARTAELTDLWSRMARWEADGLALRYFAGLNTAEIAAALRRRPEEVEKLLIRRGNGLAQPVEWISSLHPVGFFSGWVEKHLREQAAAGKLGARAGRKPAGENAGLPLAPLLRWAPVVLVAGLLGLALIGLRGQARSEVQEKQQAEATATALAAMPRTQDTALLAGEDGRIFALDLTSGVRTDLSWESFFQPGGGPFSVPPEVSPDGKWLSVVEPRNGATWLLGLDGKTRRNLSAQPLRLAWSPDGQEAVYFLPDQPDRLMHYRVEEDRANALADFPGNLLSAAWSPDHSSLAVLYSVSLTGLDGGERQYTELALLSPAGGDSRVLARFDQAVNGLDSYELFWTGNGRSVWYPFMMAAVDIADGTVRPLVTEPGDPRYDPNLAVLDAPAEERDWISPDGDKIALIQPGVGGSSAVSVVMRGMRIDRKRWLARIEPAETAAWTAESQYLLIGERRDRFSPVYRVDIATGNKFLLAERAMLLGSLSSLTARSRAQAQVADLSLAAATASSGRWQRVEYSALALSMQFPAQWQVWNTDDLDFNASLAVANFHFSGPFGLASLDSDHLMITLRAMPTPLGGLDRWIQRMVNRSPGKETILPLKITGWDGYLLVQDRQKTAYLQTPRGVAIFSYQPADSRYESVFLRVLRSVLSEDSQAQNDWNGPVVVFRSDGEGSLQTSLR